MSPTLLWSHAVINREHNNSTGIIAPSPLPTPPCIAQQSFNEKNHRKKKSVAILKKQESRHTYRSMPLVWETIPTQKECSEEILCSGRALLSPAIQEQGM
jgi:hypothetical protein